MALLKPEAMISGERIEVPGAQPVEEISDSPQAPPSIVQVFSP